MGASGPVMELMNPSFTVSASAAAGTKKIAASNNAINFFMSFLLFCRS
jgi:hypothetical protein